MGCFEIFCAICGGPSRSPVNGYYGHRLLAISNEQSGDLAWLDKHVGLLADNDPKYPDSYEFYGRSVFAQQQTAPTSSESFSSYLLCSIYELPAGDSCGVTCHAVCYDFSHARLDYKLQIQDIWPLVLELLSGTPEIDKEYGGLAKYHAQVSNILEYQLLL